MASLSGEDLSQWDAQSLSSASEEKILVSVRLRPLNEKETAKNDVSDWECINNNTIIFKKNMPERSMFPSAYTFDRVFGCESSTMQVYNEGAKEVALSVVSGINSSIFAYGQTSSGKTFTMSGITEYAVADIYNHIEQHKEREFVIKFSAIEIYNEAVRDLLSSDSTPLRLLDDPERGTVVEKLIEETPRDWDHLKELISICDDQRQIGETSLNETSSRSHQILRLTIESSALEFLRADNSSTLSASVNFIDLAGSERASQTLSAGARLKEGCHINRSLLTLGTVIRKLSKGRNGHVPYRDSKLTRILQNSLGGNARTAIICTMSPARSHVEQSRNTLLFASCAKEVSTNAQVNVVMTDKALVKQLQKELARLENELQCAGSTLFAPDSAALLREKELQIEKMEQEIRELVQQRDQAQSKINDLLQSVGDDQVSRLMEDSHQPLELHAQISEEIRTIRLNSDDILLHMLPDNSEEQFLLEGTSPLSTSTPKFPDPDPCKGWEEIAQTQLTIGDSEDVCKDVRCIEIEDPGTNKNRTIEDPDTNKNTTIEDSDTNKNRTIEDPDTNKNTTIEDPDTNKNRTIEDPDTNKNTTIEDPDTNKNTTIEDPDTNKNTTIEDPDTNKNTTIEVPDTKKNTTIDIISPVIEEQEEKMSGTETDNNNNNTNDKEIDNDGILKIDENAELDIMKQKVLQMQKIIDSFVGLYTSEQSPYSPETNVSSFQGLKQYRSKSCRAVIVGNRSPLWLEKVENMIPSKDFQPRIVTDSSKDCLPSGKLSRRDSSLTSISSFSMDEKSENVKLSPEGDDVHDQNVKSIVDEVANVQSEKKSDDNLGASECSNDGFLESERQKKEIIEQWDSCNVSLLHRTKFFSFFLVNDDPSDASYIDIERRRLSCLKDRLSTGIKTADGQILTLPSSLRDLNKERLQLSRLVYKRIPEKDRESLFQKWGISSETKDKRLQLGRRIWTDTNDMDHINESAALVAKLIGHVEHAQTPKEMVGLSFSHRPLNRRSSSWKHNMSSFF